MRLTIVVLALLIAPAAATAGNQPFGPPKPISERYGAITGLFYERGPTIFTHRDRGGQAGTTEVFAGRQRTRKPGLLPFPTGGGPESGLVIAFQRGDDLRVDLDPGVLTVAENRPDVRQAQLATGSIGGQLALGWQEEGKRLYASLREPEAEFAEPVLLAEGDIGEVALGQGIDGQTVIAWVDAGRVFVKLRPEQGAFGETMAIDTPPAEISDLTVVEGLGREPVVAWSTPDGVRAASRPEGAAAFAAPLTLSDSPARGLSMDEFSLAFGDARGVRVVDIADGRVQAAFRTGTRGSRVDDVDGGNVVYVRRGVVYFSFGIGTEVRIGRGRVARLQTGIRLATRHVVKRASFNGYGKQADKICNPVASPDSVSCARR